MIPGGAPEGEAPEVVLDPETPMEHWADGIARATLPGAVVASLGAYFLGTSGFAAVAGGLWMVGALSVATRLATDCHYELDDEARQIMYVRSLAGQVTRGPFCPYDDVALVTSTGWEVWGGLQAGRKTHWTYEVVLVTLGGEVLPLSERFPEGSGRVNELAREVARRTGATFEPGHAYRSMVVNVDAEKGELTVRHEESGGRVRVNRALRLSRYVVVGLLLLAWAL